VSEIVLSSNLVAARGFRHGFSTRKGGVSKPPFDSLDFAIDRDREGRCENQRRLSAAIDIDETKIHQARQVHGRTVVVANGNVEGMLEEHADAIVAEPSSLHAVGVRVADCGPVLVADTASGRVAALHAGWRGIVAGVVSAAINHLLSKNGAGSTRDFIAAIGPCIGACCFEVGEDVAAQIALVSAPEVVVRRDGARDKAWVDLRRVIRWQLRAAGMLDEAIDDVPGCSQSACTRCCAELFYSYRRDGDAAGRHLAVIAAR